MKVSDLNSSQEQFLANLNGWECCYEDEDSNTVLFSFVCTDHSGSMDTTQEFSVGSFEELIKRITELAEDYDPEYETYLWLDDTGHGKNGAPYSMRAILDEKEEYLSELESLAYQFQNFEDEDEE